MHYPFYHKSYNHVTIKITIKTNFWNEFTKMKKGGPSMESLIAELLHFSAKIIKDFVLSS